ncbi:MAG: hypothetical protein U5M51_02680 [Emticicia sp.]|nr:hypothetical protein [Emticicia sp.]
MKKLALVLGLAATIISATATPGIAQAKATSGTPAAGTPAAGKTTSTAMVTNLSVQGMGSLRFRLAFENPLRQKTKIYLLDKDSNVLFDEYTYGNTQYVRVFNFSNLADGEYTFVVETGKEKLKKDFAITTKTLRGVSLASN